MILIFKKKKEDERKHPFFKYGVDEHYQKDKLVKDNYCNTYIPQGKAISLNYDGQLLYFCSEECRDKFIEALKRKHNN
jgi:YHS domain-containing protein